MKNKIFLALAFLGLSTMSLAQQTQTTCGVIIAEEGILNPNHKTLVFVVAQNFEQATTVDLQTVSSEGIVHSYPDLIFEKGLRQGQMIPIWKGEFSPFSKTPWLKFDVTVQTQTIQCYSSYRVAIGQNEFYKEPQIMSVLDQTSYNQDKRFLVMGNFDTRAESLILINSELFVEPGQFSFLEPGILEIRLNTKQSQSMRKGKFLLTICQSGHCDTMQGRSR